MADSIVFRYSELLYDDGGFEKLKADFIKTGDDLIAEAKKIKAELGKALTLDDSEGISKLEARVRSLESTFKDYGKAKGSLTKIEKEYNQALQDEAKLQIASEKAKQAKIATTKKEIEAEAALNRGIQTEINTKKSQLALSEAERRASEAAAKSTGIQRGAYAMLSAELRKLFTESANVASQMYNLEQAGKKTSPEYKKLETTFNLLASRTNRLDGALKTIDASLGRHQRKVGDYAGGYNGLGNSINQLTRELPAFTYSVQTGILALSNNIPILTDEIGRLNRANVELAAAGKPTVSVLGQILKSVFSLQTAMGIGILLATLYAKEITTWAESLFGADDAMKQLTESQRAYNNARVAGTKASLEERLELNQNLKVAKNKKLSIEEREIAYQKIIDQYPFYFKALTKEQILAGDTEKAEDALRKAIEKRAQANKLSEAIVKDKSKIIDLGFQINLQKRLLKAEKESFDFENTTAARNSSHNAAVEKFETKINSLLRLRTALIFENSSREQAVLKLRSESIGLDEKLEKDKKDKNKLRDQQIQNVDYLASDYAFRKALLENAIQTNEDVFSSDKYTAEQRIDAQKNMITQLTVLNEMEKRESLRLLKKKYDEERNETIKDSEGKILGKKYTNDALIQLEVQYNLDKNTINVEALKKQQEINKKADQVMLLDTLQFQIDNLKYLQKHLSTKAEAYQAYSRQISIIQNQINQIIDGPKSAELNDKLQIGEGELERLVRFNEKLEKMFKGKDYSSLSKEQREKALKEIEKFEKDQTKIQESAELERKLNRIRSIEEEQKSFDKNTNEFKQLELEKQNILIGIQKDGIKARLEAEKDSINNFKKLSEEINKFLERLLDRLTEIQQKRVDSNEKAVENTRSAIDRQQQLAQAGLDNTLAYEQQQLAKREAALAKAQAKQEKLEKIKSLYASYSNYASKGDENALGKALRDFAILESIAASLGDGGAIDDILAKQKPGQIPNDGKGIIRGRSHRGRNGGIPILVEGKEGFFSKREMANLGKGNFYKMKEMAGMGKVDSNFFTRQRKQFNMAIVQPKENSQSEAFLQISDAIRNQPQQHWNKAEMIGDVIQVVETILKPGGKVRNTYKIPKPRL